ncbi:MAG: enolase C-terminal domain-like protein [Nitrospirota bacterium]
MSAHSILASMGDEGRMQVRSLTMTSLDIPFRQAFTHASAARSKTEAVLVRAESVRGLVGMGEGCPRHYVTGETVAGAQEFFRSHRSEWMTCSTVDDLQAWGTAHADLIDRNPAAWCAVETACLDLLGKEMEQPIEVVLGCTPLSGPFQYSAVLGGEKFFSFERQLRQYLAVGFSDFKLKVMGDLEADRERVAALTAAGIPGLRVRLDANNRWHRVDEACEYIQGLNGTFTALEEPLRVGDYEGCRILSRRCGVPIILDESFVSVGQFPVIEAEPSLWIVNIRVSKMGGLLRACAVAAQAKSLGIPIVVGAQVGETSILTRAALTVADRYRDVMTAQEGAFGTHLLEYDLCDPPLMFGRGGRLAVDGCYNRPGLGLSFVR